MAAVEVLVAAICFLPQELAETLKLKKHLAMRYERDQRSVQVSLTENVVDVFVFVLASEHLLTGSALRMFNIFKNTKKRNKKKKETKIKHAKGIQTRLEQLRVSELQNVPLRERE